MAAEIPLHWDEIDRALDEYRDATGAAWAPGAGQNFLTYLWFAYEWLADGLANEIRNEAESAGGPAVIDIRAELTKRRQIAAVWSVADVQGIRPESSGDQAWSVLQAAARRFDAEIGINWHVLKVFADELFGAGPGSADREN